MGKIVQGSAEWLQSRLGKVTASRVFDIIPGSRGKYLQKRENYMYELLAERISGVVQTKFLSEPMIHGTETEPIARAVYEGVTGLTVIECALVDHPTIKDLGASPDGLVGEDGLIEIKCPTTETHMRILAGGEIKPQYMYQMQTQMLCTGRAWCDYFDFDDRLPVDFQAFKRRIRRDRLVIELIEFEVGKFLEELDALEKIVRERKPI